MSNFVPGNYDLRTVLIFCYHLKKTAAESHWMFVEAYGEHALGKSKCFEWFKKFRSGNFDVRNEERGTWNVIYYELLKPGETVNTERYRQRMIDLNQALREKRPEYQKRRYKVILLHDNAPSHTAKPVKETIEAFSWEILSHAAYSPDLAPSDYYLFALMGHALSDQHFTSYENVRKWLDDWFASRERQFFWRGIHQLPDRWEKCIASDGQYFELNILNHFHTIKVYFLYKNSSFIFTYLVCRIIQTEGSQFEHLKVSSCWLLKHRNVYNFETRLDRTHVRMNLFHCFRAGPRVMLQPVYLPLTLIV